MPTFAAVQAWAGADRRARVVAAVNVLNAAFMVVGALLLAVLQKMGLGVATSFVLIGVANLVAAIIIGRTMPANWLQDFLSIVFRAFYRLEVKGLENLAKAGDNAIIALNHVSFLDPPLAASLLPKRPVFAIDVAMAKHWWIQPFLKFVRTMALDPLKPMAMRSLINAVRDGDSLVIFPEGRITRHRQPDESLRRRRADRRQVGRHGGAGPHRRAGGDDVQPVEAFAGAPPAVSQDHGHDSRTAEAQGRSRTQGPPAAAGRGRRALRDHVRHDLQDHLDGPHRRRSAHRRGKNPRQRLARGRRPGQRPDDLQAAAAGDRDPRRQADAVGARRALHRRHAADLQWRGRHAARGDVGGTRAGDDQLHRRSGQHSIGLPRRRPRHHPHVAGLRGKGPARQSRSLNSRSSCASSIWKTFARRSAFSTSSAAPCTGRSRSSPASPTIGR